MSDCRGTLAVDGILACARVLLREVTRLQTTYGADDIPIEEWEKLNAMSLPQQVQLTLDIMVSK